MPDNQDRIRGFISDLTEQKKAIDKDLESLENHSDPYFTITIEEYRTILQVLVELIDVLIDVLIKHLNDLLLPPDELIRQIRIIELLLNR